VFIVALALIAGGCGGSSKKKSASPTTTATAASTTTAATTTTTSAAPTFASTKNCAELIALGAKFSQALQATSGNVAASIAAETKVLQAFAAAAPSEIRGDFTTLADAFNAYAQAYAKAGLKPGKTPTAAQLLQLETAAKAFSTPKLAAAEKHLSAWSRKNCGGLTTTTTG
jgi:hypothetical protein